MTRLWTVWIAAMLGAGLCTLAPLPAAAAGEVVAPPALYMPFDARTQTEFNFSSSDVLGLVRELLPAFGDLIKLGATMDQTQAKGHGSFSPSPEAFAQLDLKPLADVLEGITNVRCIIAKYRPSAKTKNVMSFFDAGAAKAGGFSKIMSDFSSPPNMVAVYSQAEGAGLLVYGYSAQDDLLYAARLSGRLDAPKLVKWLGDTIKLFAAAPTKKIAPKTPPKLDYVPAVPHGTTHGDVPPPATGA
jgi:hypothetical protein